MKAVLTTIFFICIWHIGQTQNSIIDSLTHQLSKTQNDTNKVLIMADICFYLRDIHPDSGLVYGHSALELAKNIGFTRGEVDVLSKMGLVMRQIGHLSESFDLQMKAIKLAELHNFYLEEANCYLRLAYVFMDLDNYSKANYYFSYAKNKYEKLNNERRKAIAYMNLGDLNIWMNNLDSAQIYAQKALNNINLIQDLSAHVYSTLSRVSVYKKDYPQAFQYYYEGLKRANKLQDYVALAALNYTIAEIYKSKNSKDSSIFFAKESLKFAQLASNKKTIMISSKFLNEIYDSTNTKEAYYYYKLSVGAKDSLFGTTTVQAIQTLINNEELKQKEKEAEQLAFDNKIKQYGLLTGLVIASIIGFFLYRNNRQKQKAKTEIEKAYSDLEHTHQALKSTQNQLIQKEKLASLGELTAGIAHEIQNPLNFVNNFSELSAGIAEDLKEEMNKTDVDKGYVEELLTDLTQNQEKINHHGKRASNIVKGMLEHSRASTGERVLTDINALADEYLRLSYHGMRAKDKSFNADFKTDFQEDLPKINIIPQDIGRVVLNLMNNAFYAVKPPPAPPKGRVDWF